MPYPVARRDATTTTKSARSYKDLKCKIEQCGGRCLGTGEVCRLVPDAVQQKIWMGALKSVGKTPPSAPVPAKTATPKVLRSTRTTKKAAVKPVAEKKPTTKAKAVLLGEKVKATKRSTSTELPAKSSPPSSAKRLPVAKATPKTSSSTATPAKETIAKSSPLGSKNVSDKYTRKDELDADRKKIIDIVGEEKVRQAEAHIKSLLDKADLHIRVPGNDILEKIVDDRFKSQFETGTSNGLFDLDARADGESWLHGYDKSKTLSENRPIYGFAANADSVRKQKDDGKFADQYGDTIVRLKSDVKNRATITGNDSLNLENRASSFNNPNIASFILQHYLKDKRYKDIKNEVDTLLNSKNLNDAILLSDSSSFWETQIHEQVKPSDIAEITYTKGDKPSKKIKDWAAKNGIKINIAKKDDLFDSPYWRKFS